MRLLAYLSNVTLLFLMFLTVVDVWGRYVLNRPLAGVLELTEYLMIPIVYFSLPWCAAKSGNVRVEIFIEKMGVKKRRILDSAGYILSLCIIALLALEGCATFLRVIKERKASDILEIPAWPFYLCLVIGLILLGVTLFRQLAGTVRGSSNEC